MERLTFDGNFCDIAQCKELPCPYDNNCMQMQVWDRLKSFEDTRLSPECLKQAVEIEEHLNERGSSIARVAELIKADDERRAVVLPCKVWDRVYVPDFEAKTVLNVRVQGISVTPNGRAVLHFSGHPASSEWGDRCGVDWFLTREGAEKALEARKDG